MRPRRPARRRPASKIGRRIAGPMPYCSLPASSEPVEPQRRQADERHQVDVGIELGALRGDVAGGGLDAPARGDDVGAAADEIGGNDVGDRDRAQRRQRRRERVEALRRLGEQGGERMARQARSAPRSPRSAGASRDAGPRSGAARPRCRGRRRRAGASARTSPRAARARAAATSRCSTSTRQLHVGARDVDGEQDARRVARRRAPRARRRSRRRAGRGCGRTGRAPTSRSAARSRCSASCRRAAADRGRSR